MSYLKDMLKEEFGQSLTCTVLCSTNSETCCYELKTKPMAGKQVQLVQNLSAHWTGVKHTHKLEDFRLSHLFWIILQKQIHTVLISTWYMSYENCSTIFLSIACVKFLFLTKLDKGSTKAYTQDFQKTLEHLLFFSLISFFSTFFVRGGLCLVEVSFLNGTKQLSWCKVAVNKATV